MNPDWLIPDWDAPGVGAVMTTRRGGFSVAPYDSMNLGGNTGDNPRAVLRNRLLFTESIGVTPVYLNQVHAATVVRLVAADAHPNALVPDADASITTDFGLACAVQVADCLPVLFAAPGGVGAAHAGWRGLAAGVLEATLRALCEAARCEPAQVQTWLGACIGPNQFEVGADVLRAFGVPEDASDASHFKPGATAEKWLVNLAALARDRLRTSGVRSVRGGAWCTVEDRARFYSYRRDHSTGRMVAAVWRRY